MSSLLSGIKQSGSDNGYFITVGDCRASILALNGTNFSTSWAGGLPNSGAAGVSQYSTLVASAGALLKDMGKTIVSANRTFRKIQLVVNNSPSTFGVGGAQGGPLANEYFTGYIEMGFEGGGSPAKVARFGR